MRKEPSLFTGQDAEMVLISSEHPVVRRRTLREKQAKRRALRRQWALISKITAGMALFAAISLVYQAAVQLPHPKLTMHMVITVIAGVLIWAISSEAKRFSEGKPKR